MFIRILLSMIAVAPLLGCTFPTGVEPTKPIISKSAKRDFGFVGTWLPIDSSELSSELSGIYNKAEAFRLTIKRDDAYSVILHDSKHEPSDELKVAVFRVSEISPKTNRAILEIEIMRGKKVLHRRIAIASRTNDRLTLWTIDTRKVGKLLFDEGCAAVIEHFAFHSTIRCDPKSLLNVVSKHYESISKPSQVFVKKSPR